MACVAGPDHVAVEVALAFVDNALDTSARADVEARIDACARCRGIVAEAAREGATHDLGATHIDPFAGDAARRHAEGVLAPGDKVGRYVVERALGAGGMGVVSLARDPELRRAVVIKLVRPDAYGDEDLEDRLRREAQAMAQLSHAHVVQIFDIGRRGDRVFLAMEYVPGATLDAWLIEKPRSPGEIVAMFRQAGLGLAAAHRSGLVHRDFKPSNVLVARDGVAKVTDFGLARGAVAPTEAAAAPRMSGVHAVLTQANAVIGTPAYMAPEQRSGAVVDARSDQYAFALALLDAVVGQRAIARTVDPANPTAVAAALATVELPGPTRVAIARALDQDPPKRFADMPALLDALSPPQRRRWWPIAVGFGALGAAVAIWLATRTEVEPPCTAKLPEQWSGDRPRVVAALAASPRPFADWAAERVATSIDATVAKLGEAEVARCRTGSRAEDPCAAGLAAAIAELTADPPPADAWERAQALANCPALPARTDPRDEVGPLPPTDNTVELTAYASHAHAIAARERPRGATTRANDALELAAAAELARGDVDTAEHDLEELVASGVASGDDATQGRALLMLLEAARFRGVLKAIEHHDVRLRAVLAHHGTAPRDEISVALAEGAAFTAVGDVEHAFHAWDQAVAIATTPDDQLRALAGRARARAVLRFDTHAATEVRAAIAAHPSAGGEARRAAWLAAGDLALDAGDGKGATDAFATAERLRPVGDPPVVDQIRAARARGLAGDVDGALAALTTAAVDPVAEVRRAIGRGQVLHAAGREREAIEVLGDTWKRLRPTTSRWDERIIPPVSAGEKIALLFTLCDAQIATAAENLDCYTVTDVLEPMHKSTPDLARLSLARAREYAMRHLDPFISNNLETALAIMVAAGAAPIALAELRWRLAQDSGTAQETKRRSYAEAARAAFEAAGRTAEVAAIDDFLARGAPQTDAGVVEDAPTATIDARAP